MVRAEGGFMPKRSSTWVLPSVAFVAIAASCATSTGTTPAAADGCTSKPDGPAPQGQHWYYLLDRATKSQCWHLGPLGLPVHKSAPAPTAHAGHGAGHAVAAAPKATETAATPPTAASEPAAAASAPITAPLPDAVPAASALAPPMTPDPATTATVAAPVRAPVVAPEPKIPPPQIALPQIAPPQTVAASNSRSADAPAPVPLAAAARTPAVVPSAAQIAQPTGAVAAAAEDHSFAMMVLVGVLFIIVGPVLGITQMVSKRSRPAAVAVAKGGGRKDQM
jgi:hypothetical protein